MVGNRLLLDIVSGSRAEWGLLKPLKEALKKECYVRVIATGTHLSPYHDSDLKHYDYSVECQMASDTPNGVCKSIGLAVSGFSDLFKRDSNPDAEVLLGDRFEIVAAAIAAHVHRIPIIHLHGGEQSLGAYDNAFRHSITHMASLHFVACEAYRKRVIELGAASDTVFNVGALGCEGLTPRKGYKPTDRLLVVYHPCTLVDEDWRELFIALSQRREKLLFIKANADNGGAAINKAIDEFIRNRPNAEAYTNLPREQYLEWLKNVDGIVGNSSSGIIEAPALGVPTVNIGERQRGREQATSILNCRMDAYQICESIQMIHQPPGFLPWFDPHPPYGSGGTVEKIVRIINARLPKVKP